MRATFAAWILGALGWRAEGRVPEATRCVVVAAPHTSNWDMPLMLLFGWRFGLSPSFLMKHTVFVGPAGWLFRRVGGIAIDRRSRHGWVKVLAETFRSSDRLVLVIPPEGTRSRVDLWKSGFYHIAREAEVPLVLSYLDYGRRVGGFGLEFRPTGDLAADMDLIRDFYAGFRGRHPHLQGEVRLPEETLGEPPAAA